LAICHPGPAGDEGEGLPSAAAAAAAAAAADYTAIKAAVLVAASKEADGWIEGYRKVCKPTYIADGGRGSSGGRSRQQGITAGSSAAAHDTRVALALHQRVCQPSDDPTAAATLPSMSSTSNSSTISVSTSSGSSDPGLTSKLSPGCTISAGKVLRRASAVHGPAAAAVGSICVVKLSGPAAAAAIKAQKQHRAAAAAKAAAGAIAVPVAAELSSALVHELRLQVAEWELPVAPRSSGPSASAGGAAAAAGGPVVCDGVSVGGSKAGRVFMGWQWLGKSAGGGADLGG